MTDIASIGFKMETDDVARGIKSLETLAQQGPKVEKALDGVEKTATKAGKSLKSIGEGAGKGLDEVGRTAPKAADGVGRVAKSADDAKKALSGMGASTSGLGAVATSAGLAGRGLASMATATTQAGAGLNGFGSGLKSVQQMMREMQAQATASAQATAQMASVTTAVAASMSAMAKAQADATRTAQEMARVFQAVGVHAKDGAAGVGRMAEASNGLGAGMGLAVRGVQAFLGLQLVGWAKDSTTALYQASAAAERLKIGLDFASARGGAEEMAYLRKTTYDLGLSFQGTAQAYMQFQAAAKGTTIEGDKARAVFESISKASAVMGLTADQSSGALLALQQMISKGSVSSEELKQQLGERLPGAFQIAARSMGVTTAELGKMLEMGQVVAEDFLPKFAAELEKSLGDAPEKAAQRLDASVNRANDAWTRLKQNVGDSGVSQFWAGQLNVLTDGMGNFNNAIEQARVSGSGFGGQLLAAARAALQFINPVNAIGYSALETGNQLAEAEKKLQALKDAGAQSSSNLMLREAYAFAQRLVDKLREAAQEKRNLAGTGAGAAAVPGGDPYNDGSQYSSYTQAQKEREDAARRLAEITARQNGITKQFTDDLKAYQDALKAGVMTEKEYAAAVTEANKKRYESTEAGKEAAKQSKAGASAANAEQSTYATLVASIKAKIAANDAELFAAGKLTESEKLRVQLQAQLDSGAKKLSAAHRAEAKDLLAKLKTQEDDEKAIKRAISLNDERVASAEEMAKAMADLDKQVDAARLSIHEYSVGVQDSIEMTNLEASTLGMNAVARQTLIEQLRIEQDLRQRIQKIKDAPYKTEEARQADVEKITAEAMKAKANAQTKAYVSEWEKAFDQTSQALTDALMRGGKDGGELLRDYFRTLILRPIIKAIVDPIAAPITSGIQSMLGQGSGAGSMLGTASSAQSLWSAFSGGTSGVLASGVAGLGKLMGSSFLGELGSGIAAGGQLGISGTASLMGAASGTTGAGMAIGAAAPWIAGAAALLSIIKGFDDSGTPHSGAGAVYSKLSGVQSGAGIYNQSTFGMGHRDEYSEAMQAGISGIAQGLGQTLDAFAVSFGKTAGYSVATAFADDSSKDGSWGSLKIADELGKVLINWEDSRASKWAPREFADGEAGYKEYLNEVAMDVKNAFVAMDLPAWADQILNTATDIDTLNAALQQIATVKSVFEGLGKTMGMFADLSGELQTQLLAASGGIEALGTNAGAFYQSFYTEGDRAQTQRELQMGALGDMGLYIDPFQGDAAKEMFRLTVEEAMASGQVALAGKLLAMSASFAETADYGQTLLDATATAAKDAAQEAAAAATSWTGLGKVLAMFSGLSAEVQSGLVTASGGMEPLVSNVGAFNQGFYSEGERALSQRAQQMAALAEMGLYIDPAEGDKAKELFRSTVEGAMASGQTELAAKLLAMSGAFASTADYGQQVFEDMEAAAKSAAEVAAQTAAQSMSGAWSNFGTMAGLAAQYTGNTSGLSQQLGVVQGSYASATTTDGRVAALQQIINLEQGLWNGQQAARQAEAAAATARANAAREQVNAAKQLLSAAQGLGSYAKSLGFSEASGLGEAERLAALDSERRDLLAKARAGDTGAMQELQGVTGNYLTLAQQMAVSQQDYSVLSGRIAAELAATAAIQEASASSQVSQYERQIAAAESVASSSAGQFAVSAATQKLIDELLVESATAFETEATLTQKLIDQGAMTATALQSLPAELAGAIGASLIPAIAGLTGAVLDSMRMDGSHAGGLSYVPFDGYRAELHMGERVLTAAENRSFRVPVQAAPVQQSNKDLEKKVERLEAQMGRMADATEKLLDITDRVSADGNANATEIMNVKELAKAIAEAMA